MLLSRKKFHAKQIFALTDFMKLGPGLLKLCKTHSVKFSFHNFVDMRHKALSVTWLAGLKKNSEFSQKDFRVLLRFILKLLDILDPILFCLAKARWIKTRSLEYFLLDVYLGLNKSPSVQSGEIYVDFSDLCVCVKLILKMYL